MTDRTKTDNLLNIEAEALEVPLFERIESWLDAGDWRYSESHEQSLFSMIVSLECGTVRAVVEASDRESSEFVGIFVEFPVLVPSLRRSAVAELLARFNCAYSLPALQIDMEDGEVRARAAVDQVGKHLNEETFSRILASTLRLADRSYAAILSVAYGEVQPSIAFERVRANEAREKEGISLQ